MYNVRDVHRMLNFRNDILQDKLSEIENSLTLTHKHNKICKFTYEIIIMRNRRAESWMRNGKYSTRFIHLLQ